MRSKTTTPETAIEDILRTFRAQPVDAWIVGSTPMIMNRMAVKARQTLLMPAGRMTSAQKAVNQKHDPMEEYRNSVNRRRPEENGPTRIIFPSPAFKGAMATAAIDIPSLSKSKINRLIWVEGYSVDIYGVPQMLMSVVRNQDINHTADIRTRAILPEWACHVRLRYMEPIIKASAIELLLACSGLICGVGDFRQEKGKGNFGQFELVEAKDPRFKRIVAAGGIKAQDAALEDPDFFDQDTEDLYSWFKEELMRRDGSPNRRAKEAVATSA